MGKTLTLYTPASPNSDNLEGCLIDYDLYRLSKFSYSYKICTELKDINDVFDKIIINVLDYLSMEQLTIDFYFTTICLIKGGKLIVNLMNKKHRNSIENIIAQYYYEYAFDKKKDSFYCIDPKQIQYELPLNRISFDDPLSKKQLIFKTRKGMFSYNAIDKGTKVLLDHEVNIFNKKVLDVGCGYGAIGLTLSARGGLVTMLDTDARAVELANINLTDNILSEKAILFDFVNNLLKEKYDYIFSNPPTHLGSEGLQSMFKNMQKSLSDNGKIFLVIKENLNYEKWCRTIFKDMEVDKKDGYKILILN